jgi:hypothetical protein
VKYTLAFALQLREKHGKTSVRVVGKVRVACLHVQYNLRRILLELP